jgi:hypothetical protein
VPDPRLAKGKFGPAARMPVDVVTYWEKWRMTQKRPE